jgi:mono/diheme cytochrome c family protein
MMGAKKKPSPIRAARATRSVYLLMSSGLVIATIVGVNAAQVGSVSEGREIARQMCAECHLLGEEAGLSTNANAPTFKDIANTPGMSGAALRASWQGWHKNMPNLIIKDEEADSLVAYILSLKKMD